MPPPTPAPPRAQSARSAVAETGARDGATVSGAAPPQTAQPTAAPLSEERVSLPLKAAGVLVLCATLGWLLWRCAAATRLGSAAGSKHTAHTAALLPCEAWDEGQVLRWLREDVSLPQLEPAFAQWRVDGPLLLELDATDLEEMGVDSRLQRKRVMSKIDQLRALSMAKALATPHHKPRRV